MVPESPLQQENIKQTLTMLLEGVTTVHDYRESMLQEMIGQLEQFN